MTRDEQKQFVTDLVACIQKPIIEAIEAGNIPESWDGIEFRQLLADKFSHSTKQMGLIRRRAYLNDCIVKNL